MRNFADKTVGKIKTHVAYSVAFSRNSCRYEIKWEIL